MQAIVKVSTSDEQHIRIIRAGTSEGFSPVRRVRNEMDTSADEVVVSTTRGYFLGLGYVEPPDLYLASTGMLQADCECPTSSQSV
jgi:hypothetical protein